MTTVDPGDPELLHVQLAEVIRQQIVHGEIPPRRKIPTQEQLAEVHEVSRGTVLRATATLTDEGWLRFVPGRGLFSADAADIDRLKRARAKKR